MPKISSENLKINYEKILQIMYPVLPHLISECMEDLNIINTKKWPDVNQADLKSDNYKIVIQINGKKRSLVNTTENFDEKTLIDKIKNDPKLSKFLNNNKIKRSIYIENKLLNLII